jgi:uncharacterized OsmC-like protein
MAVTWLGELKTEVRIGPADLDEAQRQRLHDIAAHCPVHRALGGGVQITHA